MSTAAMISLNKKNHRATLGILLAAVDQLD
jgi:hypothetical protein